jgi:hypothetical protein
MGIYGGGGYMALSADGKSIVGFGPSFEFGGVSVYSSVRMIGNGRLTTGIFVRNYTTDVLGAQLGRSMSRLRPHSYPTASPCSDVRKRHCLSVEIADFVGLTCEITTLITARLQVGYLRAYSFTR